MGPKYSKGAKVVSLKLDRFRVMTMLEVRSKAIIMSKIFGQRGLYFLTHEQLTRVFQMSGDEIYLLERSFAAMPRINSLDFFCALALAASGANDDKLTFCCKIMDTNGDDKLSYHEVIILFICATRGIASLKGLEYIPEATLDKVVMDAFSTHQHALKDNGEMLISTLTTFILNHELCRAYLVSLGAKIPPVDTNAMVSKRTFFMKELVSTRCQIEEVIMAMQDLSKSQALFGERGGDIEYLKMSSQPFIAPSLPSTTTANRNNDVIPTLLLRDPSHPINKYFKFDNSWTAEKFAEIPFPLHFNVEATTRYEIDRKQEVNSSSQSKDLTNTENANQSIFAQAFASKLRKSWYKVPHDCADMAVVDAFTIIAIFQELDINLPFSFANQCIQHTSKSQFGKIKFGDVLHYFRLIYNPSRAIDFGNQLDAKKIDVFGHTLTHTFTTYTESYKNLINTIQRQRRILQGFEKANVVNLAKKLADFRSMSMKRPSIANFQFYFNESNIDSRTPLEDERVKLHELYIFKSKIRVNITTNPFNNLSTKRPKESSRIHLVRDDTDPLLDSCSSAEYKMMFVVEDSEELNAADFLDFYNLLQEKDETAPPVSSTAADAIGNSSPSKIKKKKRVYNSVIFATIDLQDNLDYSQALILQKALFNFFTAIPLHIRQGWYTDVKVEIFTKVLEASSATANPTKKASFFMANKSNKSRISQANIQNKKRRMKSIFIALFHEHDHFAELEKQLLEADIYLSRFLHNFDLEVDISQSWTDIFQKSFNFHNLSEKLFGPQENELGDEGSNPLRFAKEIRRKKHYFQDIISRLLPSNADETPSIVNESKPLKTGSLLTREELMSLCREYGVKDQGSSLAQLQTRIMRLMERKLELLGHGDISDFGRNCIREMVMKMKKRNVLRHTPNTTTTNSNSRYSSPNKKPQAQAVDSSNLSDDKLSLSLWEMNDLLLTICNTQTFYSKVEYAGFLHEHELLFNRDLELTLKGLQYYYELHGGLQQDITQSTMIGNLDAILAGRVTINTTFDSDALASIANLLPDHALFIPQLFQFLLHISTLKEVKLDGKVDKFSDIFAYLFNHFFTQFPWKGIQADKIKAFMSNVTTLPAGLVDFYENEFRHLTDVKEGIIPAIRRHLATFNQQHSEERNSGVKSHNKAGSKPTPASANEETKEQEEYLDYTAVFGGQQYVDKVYEEIDKVMEILVIQRQQQKEAAEKATAERLQQTEQAQLGPAISNATNNAVSVATTVAMGAVPAPTINDTGSNRSPEEINGDQTTDNEAAAAQQQQQHCQRDKEAAYEQELLFLQFQSKIKLVIMQQHAIDALPTLLTLSHSSSKDAKTKIDFANPDLDFNTLNSELLEEVEQVDFHKLRQEIVDNLIFLNNIRTVESLSLSLEESQLIEHKKVEFQQKLQVLNQQELLFETQFLRHVLAAYDAMRTFATSVSSFGIGTKDCSGRITLEGFPTFDSLFPSGMNGEKSFVQQQTDEKKMRFENRKNLALAALERERLRRQLTDEDIERIRKEKLQKQKIKYEKEEMRIFQFALQQLDDSRHNKKSMAELASMIKKFEGVLKLKESRFPCELPAQVMKSNMACLLYEVYGLDHPLCEPAQYFLQDACEHLLTVEEPELIEPEVTNNNKDEESTAYDAESQANSKLSSNDTNSQPINKLHITSSHDGDENGQPPVQITELQQKKINNATIKILIILNYLQILNESHAYSAMKQAERYKLYLHQCYHRENSCLNLLTAEDKQALFDINKTDFYSGGVTLFRLKDFHPAALLETTLLEAVFIFASNEEDENDENSSIASQTRVSQQEILEINEEQLQDTTHNNDTVSITSSQQHKEQERLEKQRRKEKRDKYEEQRRKDAQRRADVAKQRNMLYKLIQSDQISDIFAARAGHMKSLSAPSWKTDTGDGQQKDEAAEEFNELANMVADQESRRLKAVAASQEEQEKKQKEAETSTLRKAAASGTSPAHSTSRTNGRK